MKKISNHNKIARIIDKDLERVVYVPKRILNRVGSYSYIELLPHDRVCFRRRLINYHEVNKLQGEIKAFLIGLVSHSRTDGYLKFRGEYLNTNGIVKSFQRMFGTNSSRYILGLLNALIQQGFIEQEGNADTIRFKVTAKAVLPHDQNKIFAIKDQNNVRFA
ncbi:hypothetical protein [uncultured Phascolarctobacterium sp.]|uniref:hypothetical protein n=1 Tax=uncultured Phascolarctobacterium sp. TaxID=512296 RepID=UPI0027D963BA|nr:hypothetical protein [uncultured Phascolarctobacterium sp.]